LDLFRRKPIADDPHRDTELHRALSATDLVLLGVGGIIGAGVFVLTGVAAATQAGPAIVLSYVIAGTACAFAALSYAELASMVGGAGGAYGYSYAGFGEFIGWLIGWDLMLEYALAVAAVAVGWSGYANNALESMGVHIPDALLLTPQEGGIVNLPAVLIVLVIGCLLAAGVRGTARFNAAIVFIKLTAIAVFLLVAFGNIDPSNWRPFAPFGWGGIMQGAALIFFAYIGFDGVSTAAEEARNPQRDLPIGIIGSLAVCTVVYILVASFLTGMAKYTTLNVPSPVADALLNAGYNWAAGIVAAGAIAGLTSVILLSYYGQTRVFFAMSRDGLLPPVFADVHPTRKSPIKVIMAAGIVMATVAGLVPLGEIAELVNIGTLAAFSLVCGGVVVMRYRHPEVHRPFRVPGSPVVPLLGVGACVYLMVHLPALTWERFVIWMIIGLFVYFLYSARHSVLARAD
jgi:APA family basic amino acid/polyamine antiporter